MELYDEIMNPKLLVRRIAISANHVVCEGTEQNVQEYEQLNLFTDYGTQWSRKRRKRKNWRGKNECSRRFWRSRKSSERTRS